ncbi:MAG: copper resistance protein CopC [Chloroflexota bacterium]|nr:copper resistance protein CopC [Chloroflexota bacterium]
MALTLGMPILGYAHETLKRAEPAPGSTLSTAPRELRLTFTAAPELASTRIELLGPDSATIALGLLRLDTARTIVAEIRGPLVAGRYSVVWRVAGRDGHPVRGRYSFTIAPGAVGLAAPTAAQPPGAAGGRVAPPGQTPLPAEHHDEASMPQGSGFGAESPLYVAVRWLTFTALLIVLGVVAFKLLVLGYVRRQGPPAREATLVQPASTRAAGLGLAAAVGLGVLALVRLYAQSYAMHGAGDALNPALVTAMLTGTVWGWGWFLQVAATVIAIAGFAMARGRLAGGWALATLGAVTLAFTPALSGHAASAPRLEGLAILADGLHVMGAGGWLGSLFAVLVAGIPIALRCGDAETNFAVADLVNAFSPTALVFAGTAAATGVFTAWLHLETWSALWQTEYGRTLLVKLAILSVVIGAGAYNWLRVKPALGDAVGSRRIRRSATVELTAAVLVLIVTAVLVATRTPTDVTALR